MSVMDHHVVHFEASGRGKARCAPDPNYPRGIAIDSTRPGEASCLVGIPYPSPECGMVHIDCYLCRQTLSLTVAGRPDDPVSVKMPCNLSELRGVN